MLSISGIVQTKFGTSDLLFVIPISLNLMGQLAHLEKLS